MKNLNDIKNSNKFNLIDTLVLKNIKGGTGCPPPIGHLRNNLQGDPPPFGI